MASVVTCQRLIYKVTLCLLFHVNQANSLLKIAYDNRSHKTVNSMEKGLLGSHNIGESRIAAMRQKNMTTKAFNILQIQHYKSCKHISMPSHF